MKFIGRFAATIPTLIIAIWIIEDAFSHRSERYFLLSIFLAVLSVTVAWLMGGQYDRARKYYSELLINKKVLQKQKDELQEIFDNVNVSFWSNDLVHKKILATKGIEKLTGYKVEQFYEDYSFWLKIIHQDDLSKAIKFNEKLISGESDYFEGRYINADGKPIWVYIAGSPVFDTNTNQIVKVNGVVLDITERKEAEVQLQESEQRYRNVVELSPNIIVIFKKEKIVYANPATLRILGINNKSEIIGKSILTFIFPSYKERLLNRMKEIHAKKITDVFEEYLIVRPDGAYLYLEMAGMEISHKGDPAIMTVAIDVTAKKEYQDKITFMAYHDALTGLPNRRSYIEYLEEALDRCKMENNSLVIMLIDIDHFKFINDTLGHAAGDELLVQASRRLSNNVREGDKVFRLGGDEFSIVMVEADEKEIREVADKIMENFERAFFVKNQEIQTTPSIGISMYPLDGADRETLNSKADIAMYLAKKLGKNNYQFFNKNGEILERKLRLEQDLKKGIDNQEFYLEFQPCVELKTGKVYCVEALVRWQHFELGKISPLEFIPIAEENGRIVMLGKWILNEACRQNKIWLEKGIHVKVAVNVSSIQFETGHFAKLVEQVLQENDLPPQYLEIEITESVTQNIKKTFLTIQELKELGVKISIDDFGTGYSSLSVLSQLPINHVKIDKSFVNEITTNKNTASLVKTMIEMGTNLHYDLIAEGIEHKEQADFLIKNGCRFGQGYYYSRPLPPSEVEKVLVEHQGF